MEEHKHLNLSGKKLLQLLNKYKYPALVLILGAVLMLFPVNAQKKQTDSQQVTAQQTSTPQEDPLRETEQQLSKILSCIDGAGTVEVMLSLRSGDRTEYQVDRIQNNGTENSQTSETTVLMESENGGETALAVQTCYGEYRGALIVSAGADNPVVKFHLVNAVASLTGLPSDRITVAKMKS